MNFYQEVYKIVRKIPVGKVMTYGQVAARVSSPRAARVVGFALRALPDNSNVPWQRVINSKGMISIENMAHPQEEQADLLVSEGIEIRQENGQFRIDLKKYIHDNEEDEIHR
jgi:methylated-DNA-protein-cysteine methyltransferase related protein